MTIWTWETSVVYSNCC